MKPASAAVRIAGIRIGKVMRRNTWNGREPHTRPISSYDASSWRIAGPNSSTITGTDEAVTCTHRMPPML